MKKTITLVGAATGRDSLDRKPIRWGIIGGGEVVRSKSGPGFVIPGKSSVYGVMRRDLGAARELADALGATEAFDSVEKLAADENIDAVYIATPPGLHKEHALQCLRHGKVAYIEKPLATTLADAEELVSAFREKGVPLFVAHYRRAIERFKLAKSLVSLRLGDLYEFSLRLERDITGELSHPWLFDKSLSGGGKFADIAPHSIDMLLYLLGDIEDKWAAARHVRSPNHREDLVCLGLSFSSGAIGTAMFNFLSDRRFDELIIRGAKGSLKLSIHGVEPIVLTTRDRIEHFDCPLPAVVEAPMIGEVVSCLRGEAAQPAFGFQALPTVALVEYALSALR